MVLSTRSSALSAPRKTVGLILPCCNTAMDGARLLRVMVWVGRHSPIRWPQLAAQGLLRDADLIFLPDPLAQNDYATADRAVYRRYKRCTLLVIESRRLAGSLAVYHPIGPCALNRSTRHTQLAASPQPYPCSLARTVRRSLVAS